MLAPTEPTWQRGIDLGPATPRLIQSIANVYRDFVQTSKTPDERAYFQAQVEKWEVRP